MKCPYCTYHDIKVIDSRNGRDGASIRRRRECLNCNARFTTHERIEELNIVIVKKDGSRQPFDRKKIIYGLHKACEKRPVSVETIENLVADLEREIRERGEKEVKSKEIGEKIIAKLYEIDEVAYVRFASVYRSFKDVTQFMDELEELLKEKSKTHSHYKMLIDTHAHLVSLEDFQGSMSRAQEVGVEKIISVSTDLDSCYKTVEIANSYGTVFAAVGVHPHSASKYTKEMFSKIEELVSQERVVAVGETGLDYHYMNSPKEIQIESFQAHIDMATKFNLPFVIHVRESDEDMLSILRGSELIKNPGVVHCFSGNYEMAKQYLELGFFISFSGIVTFNRAEDVREAAKKIPSDKILIETDSPYLAPVPLRGKKNEPANVKYVAQVVAEVRGIDMKTLQDQLLKNTLELFPKIGHCL